MTGASEQFASQWGQSDRGLGLLRLSALHADTDAILDQETFDAIVRQVRTGVLADTPHRAMWPELAAGLMAPQPGMMIRVLRETGVLSAILPELASLFGVPQIADDPPQVDLGIHLMRTLNQTAKLAAPLEVRFAALVMNVGKSDSPAEHLPVHYAHIERGGPRIEAICARFAVPDSCRELALLALGCSERVHRVSRVRAGPIAAMLERLGAFDRPALFRNLLLLCRCDYNAFARLVERPYQKAALLEAALAACSEIDPQDQTETIGHAAVADRLHSVRASAIAAAFRSLRWEGDEASSS